LGEFVGLEVNDGVGTIRLDRPPANAADSKLGAELSDAVREAGDREDVGAVVVWGGPKIFCAGADIKEMADFGPDEIRPVASTLGAALDALEMLPKVTIAAINGFALGAGCEIALATDLRYAASDAQIGQPEILIGVIPGAGGTQRLSRAVGHARAREMVLSGRRVDAVEADDIGLVTRILPPEKVLEKALEDARVYASGPRRALASAKRALAAASQSDPAEGLRVERDVFCELFGTWDQAEGMRAFLEKRAPRFEGR
jgi:enoyl-CoA hydratase/carnithine racemase